MLNAEFVTFTEMRGLIILKCTGFGIVKEASCACEVLMYTPYKQAPPPKKGLRLNSAQLELKLRLSLTIDKMLQAPNYFKWGGFIISFNLIPAKTCLWGFL